MKPLRLLLILSLLATTLAVSAKTKSKNSAKTPTTLARLTLDGHDGTIYLGDSAVVYLTLYATMPFESAEIKAPKLKVKGCSVRRVPLVRHRQRITMLDNKSYYTYTCAAFVVTPHRKGKATFPAVRFDGVVLQQEPQQRHVDPFWGPFDDFFFQPKYKQLTVRGKASKLKFRIQPAPLKTIEQLRREGRTVM